MAPGNHTLRPDDRDALRGALRQAHRESGLAVLFGGEAREQKLVLTEFVGVPGRALRNLQITSGVGMGGHVLQSGRAVGAEDYYAATFFTHDYDWAVRSEGLRSMVAVPVRVRGVTRAVLYAAARERTPFGDRAKNTLMGTGRKLANEILVRDEVDRRLAMMDALETNTPTAVRVEDLREIHAELRLLSQSTKDSTCQEQLSQVCHRLVTAIAGDQPGPDVRLSHRETDVLTQISLGCTNVEIAERLSLTTETVKSYLRSVMRKLDVHTRHQAVVRARQLRLLP